MPKRAKRKADSSIPVETVLHKDAQRRNIPTAELETFLRADDRQPKLIGFPRQSDLLYPREPAADPQLVWRGKDEQDRLRLEVTAPPIYIQEKIHPKAIIEDLRAEKRGDVPTQANLFSDFNGIDFDHLVDFYKHEQNWSNRMILGDSLEVMASLTDKEGLKGQVQCIYVDPPYGIKFGSNWQVSTRKRDVKDGRAEDATRQPEQVRAFRDTWELGIHSYLTYLRDRLTLARELLAHTGSIFVQIGDENVHLVRSILDEVFGRDNFCGIVTFAKTSGAGSPAIGTTLLPMVTDFLLWYARDRPSAKYRQIYEKAEPDTYAFPAVELPDGSWRRLTPEESSGASPVPGRLFRTSNLTSQSGAPSTRFPVEVNGRAYLPSGNSFWKTNAAGMQQLLLAGRLVPVGNTLTYKRYQADFPARVLTNFWKDTIQSTFATQNIFVVQTYTKVVQRCLIMTTDPGDLVLDPTCGSGTTAYVAEQWGRRWITIDTSRVALTLAKLRLMSARFPYYKPADEAGDLRRGFRYETVPHVTLKSIANNLDIHKAMTRDEVDRSIQSHTESEYLYEQPHVEKAIVRVTGPFTIESLSPVLAPTPDGKEGAHQSSVHQGTANFEAVILDNLRRAGVQNTVRHQRLTFDTLTPWAGRFVHAVGEYYESSGPKRAAICIGPQYGTVDADLVRDAAKEAAGYFDILIVCGFAFDAYIPDQAKLLGNLTVLKASMNPDLSMGGDLLKKTGTGNLFTIFGEPDIRFRQEGGEMVVEIRGLDVFDPTTGQIRSHTTDDIACWFIDTDYNAESFFIRHAYFTGGNDPYAALKRALKADIDEQTWATLYSTTSRPFPRPKSGKIAVKVINHYGDEVMKIYPVAEELKYPIAERPPLLRAAERRPKK